MTALALTSLSLIWRPRLHHGVRSGIQLFSLTFLILADSHGVTHQH